MSTLKGGCIMPIASFILCPRNSYRIQNDVSGDLQQVAILLDQDGLEPSLEQVSVAFVSTVE